MSKTKPQLIAQMIVRNEEHRFLKDVIAKACLWADKIIVVDDCSTDGTFQICQSFAPKVEVYAHTFGRSMFGEDESALREFLWQKVRRVASEGDWIVSLDADEEFDTTFTQWGPSFTRSSGNYDYVTFKLADMWTPTQYRVDGYWSPLITRMFRYQNQPFGVTGKLHAGCIPAYVWQTKNQYMRSHIRLKHLGWIRDEDKKRKAEFYLQKSTGINLVHAKTIFQKPTLKDWTDTFQFPNVLVTSLIRNRAWCLPKFLKALDQQTKTYPPEKLSYLFLINDSVDDSEKILTEWAKTEGKKYRKVQLTTINFKNSDAVDHTWSEAKLQNMARMRDICLDNLVKSDNEYLFSIDSDIILDHDDTLRHMICLERQIISEVFWAKWEHEGAKPLPNVWLSGGYHITDAFLAQLKRPGTYEVGGLGAITTIHRSVPELGVTYQRVPNLPSDMRGEDRDFCIRATCAGLKLWADTFKTPTHLERDLAEKQATEAAIKQKEVDKTVEKVTTLQAKDLKFEPTENTISLCMIVKNESKNIKNALESARPLVQELIVVDTGSTDGTQELAKQVTDQVYDYQWCDDFSAARNFAIEKAKGKWILFLDGDEVAPPETLQYLYKLIQTPNLAAVLLPVKNIHIPTPQNPSGFHYSETYRLFLNTPEIRFSGCVHEDIAPSLEKFCKSQKNLVTVRSEQFITNLGFLIKPKELKDKHSYYGQLLLKEIDRNPNYFKPYYEYAVYLLDQGRLEEAEKYYKKAIELSQGNFWMAHNDLGVIYMRNAVNLQLLSDATACFELAAIKASKKASGHHRQVIENNVQIGRMLAKALGLPSIKINSDKKESAPQKVK